VRISSLLDFLPLPFDLGVEEERVPGLVKRVGDRPTGSSKKPKPPFGGTNPSTKKTQQKGELKSNQKQKYQPKDQNFKLTKNNLTTNHTIKGKTCHVVSSYSTTNNLTPIVT